MANANKTDALVFPEAGSGPGNYLDVEGFIDHRYDDRIEGWAWDEFDPAATVSVDIFDGDSLLATVPADRLREDLQQAGIGDGRHGFDYVLPPGGQRTSPSRLRAKAAGTKIELFEPPQRYATPQPAIPVPPEDMRRTTGHPSLEDFTVRGQEVARACKLYGRLRPRGRILDVGCGVGRLAYPLALYLAGGSYDGLDIIREMVDWCAENITSKYPHLRFRHADVNNAFYNPSGQFRASEYRLPYESGSYDVVFLGSVFTHLLPPEFAQYVSEVTRVLRPGGRCLSSYFLLKDGALKSPAEKSLKFIHAGDAYRTTTAEVPEAAVAYEEVYVRARYASAGLEVIEPIHYGGQDLVVAAKKTRLG
jgi:SAM-dependent methyltransferase